MFSTINHMISTFNCYLRLKHLLMRHSVLTTQVRTTPLINKGQSDSRGRVLSDQLCLRHTFSLRSQEVVLINPRKSSACFLISCSKLSLTSGPIPWDIARNII